MTATPETPVREMVDHLLGMQHDQASRDRLMAAAGSYAYWWNNHFSIEHDPSQVHGETNHFRYRPRPWHVLRLYKPRLAESLLAASMTAVACRLAGVHLQISMPRADAWSGPLSIISGCSIYLESHELLVSRLGGMRDGTVRVMNPVEGKLFEPAKIGNIHVAMEPVFANGRIEMLHYLREQAMSQTVHRYGNIL